MPPQDTTTGGSGEPGRLPVATCAFPASASSIHAARRWARGQLAAWSVPPGVLDVAVLLLSEIATNAVTHAGGERISIRLVLDGDLQVAVHDDDARGRPHLLRPLLVDTTGRGLVLVRAFASSWGTLPDEAGKWVWFRVPFAGPAG